MHGKVALLFMVHLHRMIMRQGSNVINARLATNGSYSGMSIQQVYCCVALQTQHVIQHEPATMCRLHDLFGAATPKAAWHEEHALAKHPSVYATIARLIDKRSTERDRHEKTPSKRLSLKQTDSQADRAAQGRIATGKCTVSGFKISTLQGMADIYIALYARQKRELMLYKPAAKVLQLCQPCRFQGVYL